MDASADRNEHLQRLGELIKDIKIAMLTTAEADGSLRSRPMATQQTEFDGDLWFFTRGSAPKVDEVEHNHHVNLSYAAPDDNCYVSVSGLAEFVRDHEKAAELWNPFYKAWFPQGLDDPDLALLKVNVQQAEYWDSASSTMVHIAGFVKTLVTAQSYSGGEQEKLNLETAIRLQQ